MKSLKVPNFLKLLVDFLAENRLLPKNALRYRGAMRIKFLKSFAPVGGVGAEIGVQKGFFTHAILHHTKPSRLHLIDPWYLIGQKWPWSDTNKSTIKALSNVLYWFEKELVTGKVILHIDFDEHALSNLPDNYFDWVYLDTSHSYEHTKRELALLDLKVKPTGIILGDDWFSNSSHPFFGQYQAIKEFISEEKYHVLYASDTDHQWAISKEASTDKSTQSLNS